MVPVARLYEKELLDTGVISKETVKSMKDFIQNVFE